MQPTSLIVYKLSNGYADQKYCSDGMQNPVQTRESDTAASHDSIHCGVGDTSWPIHPLNHRALLPPRRNEAKGDTTHANGRGARTVGRRAGHIVREGRGWRMRVPGSRQGALPSRRRSKRACRSSARATLPRGGGDVGCGDFVARGDESGDDSHVN